MYGLELRGVVCVMFWVRGVLCYDLGEVSVDCNSEITLILTTTQSVCYVFY